MFANKEVIKHGMGDHQINKILHNSCKSSNCYSSMHPWRCLSCMNVSCLYQDVQRQKRLKKSKQQLSLFYMHVICKKEVKKKYFDHVIATAIMTILALLQTLWLWWTAAKMCTIQGPFSSSDWCRNKPNQGFHFHLPNINLLLRFMFF